MITISLNYLRLIFLPFCLAASSVSASNYVVPVVNLCVENKTAFSCLEKNFDTLYQARHERFWEILHQAAKRAQKCDSSPDTAKFLGLAKLKTDNVEFDEFFRQNIEKLCIKHTNCFLNSLLKTDDATRTSVVEKLRQPLYEDEADIKRVFLKAKSKAKYKKIGEMYFENDPIQ